MIELSASVTYRNVMYHIVSVAYCNIYVMYILYCAAIEHSNSSGKFEKSFNQLTSKMGPVALDVSLTLRPIFVHVFAEKCTQRACLQTVREQDN